MNERSNPIDVEEEDEETNSEHEEENEENKSQRWVFLEKFDYWYRDSMTSPMNPPAGTPATQMRKRLKQRQGQDDENPYSRRNFVPSEFSDDYP